MGARVLGRAPRRGKLRIVGRRDAGVGAARHHHHGRPARLHLPRGLSRRRRCSWRCRRVALLTYPRPRWREVDVLDKDGKPTGERRTECSFRRAHGRAKLWRGVFCENAVQAAAADLLREAVTRIETDPGARVHADPHDHARRNRLRSR